MKISLCIISRKEDSASLWKALDSVADHVDEVVVVDTSKKGKYIEWPKGSIDWPFKSNVKWEKFKWWVKPASRPLKSEWENIRKELTPEYRDDYEKWATFIEGRTGLFNFSDARNFSFEQATGDVIFWIDSDDVVKNPENLPILAKKITDGEVDWIYSEYIYQKDEFGNILAKHWKPRLMKKGTGHWVGNVHEDFMPDSAVIQKRDDELGVSIVIDHQSDSIHTDESAKRNLEIQLAEIERDGDKVDPRTLQYTGMSYQALEDWANALPYFLRHAQVTGSKEDKFWSLYRASLCAYFLNDPGNALNLALDSLKLFPEWKTSYFMIAAIYASQEEWSKVIEWTLTGLEKSDPTTLQVISEIDYTILPLSKLSMAYLQTGNYELANDVAMDVYRMNKGYPGSQELVKMCMEAIKLEGFVKSFLEVAANVKVYDRVKATKLFDLLPAELDEDYRIQTARSVIVPPKIWPVKSIVIYCGRSLEEWAYPSIFTGIGGSEKAVINMSKELVKQGYSVTVYNRCGNMKGTYDGVEYLPYYFFNPNDSFDTLIGWRNPLLFMQEFHAKRKYLWLHDIAQPFTFNQKIYDNLDKVFFLSKWHRSNLPDCPEDKVFITNNGINPDDFKFDIHCDICDSVDGDKPHEHTKVEKRPNSLIWSSSYDRGLLPFMKNIWPLIKKEIPEVTLDVAYGWQNIEKEMSINHDLAQLYKELSPILENTPGVTHHGRISHKKLANLMGSSMVYPYASEFGETNNMTSQECQAAGCYVITTSQAGGTPERVIYGEVIAGDNIYTDAKLQRRFADRVVANLRGRASKFYSPGHRPEDVLKDFSWNTTAEQWIKKLSL